MDILRRSTSEFPRFGATPAELLGLPGALRAVSGVVGTGMGLVPPVASVSSTAPGILSRLSCEEAAEPNSKVVAEPGSSAEDNDTCKCGKVSAAI